MHNYEVANEDTKMEGYVCPHCGEDVYYMVIANTYPVAHPYLCSKCGNRYMLLCDLKEVGGVHA